ncbi:MAG TPA: HAMP domain-containing sensor histidine kinase [Flavipsychrobacter sp.]
MKVKSNYPYLLVGIIIAGLIGVQLYWINKTIQVEKNAINRSLTNDLEKIANNLEESSYCFVLYAKTYINKGEGIYLVRQKLDSSGRYLPPEKGGFVDTVNMYNFFTYEGDTMFSNYPSIEMTRFATSLDVSFNFAIEGVKDPSQYAFQRLSADNMSQAFDNTMKIDTVIDADALDAEIKTVLQKNGLDTIYAAGIRKGNNSPYLLLTDSTVLPMAYKDVIEVPFFNNNVTDPYLLVVGVPQPFSRIVRSLSVMMISSAIIVLLLVIAFVYFVRTIINQKKLSEMKNIFINNITHEFRTPITNISLAVENWRETKKNPEFYYNIIEEENRHLEKNVEQILQIATLKHNGMCANHKEVNMHDIIHKTVNSFTMQLNNVNGTISLNLRSANPVLYADEREMQNMMMNMVDNAIKYSKGRPDIKITTYEEAQQFVIEVEDNGIGISTQVQKHIFDRFYRHTKGDRHDVKGFGLGLSYVKHIIESHNGEIHVKSKQDKGTTFTIYLPKNKKAS